MALMVNVTWGLHPLPLPMGPGHPFWLSPGPSDVVGAPVVRPVSGPTSWMALRNLFQIAFLQDGPCRCTLQLVSRPAPDPLSFWAPWMDTGSGSSLALPGTTEGLCYQHLLCPRCSHPAGLCCRHPPLQAHFLLGAAVPCCSLTLRSQSLTVPWSCPGLLTPLSTQLGGTQPRQTVVHSRDRVQASLSEDSNFQPDLAVAKSFYLLNSFNLLNQTVVCGERYRVFLRVCTVPGATRLSPAQEPDGLKRIISKWLSTPRLNLFDQVNAFAFLTIQSGGFGEHRNIYYFFF